MVLDLNCQHKGGGTLKLVDSSTLSVYRTENPYEENLWGGQTMEGRNVDWARTFASLGAQGCVFAPMDILNPF